MTVEEIQRLLKEDPQKLVDDAVIFRFNEVEGKVKLIDGVAAGGPWEIFEFVDGPYKGKVIACTENCHDYEKDDCTFTYLTHTSDDGMLFNKDPERFNPDEDDDWGGDYIPELDGVTFSIREA